MESETKMANGFARIDAEGHRIDVLIDRPEKRNAMNEEVIYDLIEAFRTIETFDEGRVVTSIGEGAVFCARMDLKMMRERVVWRY